MLQRVHVGLYARREIGAAFRGEPPGCQRLEPFEEPHAQLREEPEGRLVRDDPLRVASSGAQDGEEPDAGGGQEVVHQHAGQARHSLSTRRCPSLIPGGNTTSR